MTAADFFFITAGLSMWIIILTWLFIFFRIIRIIAKAESDVASLKNTLKLNGLKLLSKVLGSSKGGESNGNKQ
jgi:hypothetical protein